MANTRIFVPVPLTADSEITLEHETHHYLANVLRIRNNDTVTLFNGHGGEFQGGVKAIEKKRSIISIGAFDPVERESPLQVHVGQALVKSDKMDQVIQKAVELGVQEVTPLVTARCDVKLVGERLENKLRHWLIVAQQASAQCGRNRILKIHSPKTLEIWGQQSREHKDGLFAILDPHGDRRLKDIAQAPQKVLLAVGPEGGFEPHEIHGLHDLGWIRLKFGQRILRTETAAQAVTAAIQARWGDA